ncbi:hypothetical protein AB0758_38710 [Tolypothrix bouteillei VB521301_2]|nr:hypothetical protein [Tolypothrix bouteillei]KAF3890004.1 hypothetical protein DA73_0400034490 [Tolypothrix bouteillei VB521301]
MWQLTDPTTRKAGLNFVSSGQSVVSVTQLWDGNVQLINAIEFVNWGELPLQFVVCEACGFVGCQDRGWVELKRCDSIAMIMPAFTIIEEAEDMKEKYLPPDYIKEKGVICIAQETYVEKLSTIAPFPEFWQLPQMTVWEALKIFQLEAPGRVLGDLWNPPDLCENTVIASDKGDCKEQTKQLISLVRNLLGNMGTAKLCKATERDRLISLYLDIPGFPEWKALTYDGSSYSLYLEPGYIIN